LESDKSIKINVFITGAAVPPAWGCKLIHIFSCQALMRYTNDEKPSNRPKGRLIKGIYTGAKSKVLF